MTKYCVVCNKKIGEMQDERVCRECSEEIKGSFGFFIGGKRVLQEQFDRIVKRGYVIPEELDEDRK